MNFKQFYLGCLSHASYYLGSDGEAAVIDPQRDVQQYLDEAEANGQRIKYVIETHSHADFVSGHTELAARTGAQIVYGERAATAFPTLKVKDGDRLQVGNIELSFIETPGHTPEGITVVAKDGDALGEPLKVFTGDTLFIGDVGRPDLVGSKGFTAEQMAGMLYDSLHDKLLRLPDEAEIYPAHGAGSLCGKSLSKETWSTLGVQRKANYALQSMSKDEFVRTVTASQSEVPAYFQQSAARNLQGSPSLEDIPKPQPLSGTDALSFDGVIIDVQPNSVYGSGHIPNAVNIGLGGQFAVWAGSMIPIGTPIAIAAETQDQIDEAVMRLARVGHDTAVGSILMKDFEGDRKIVEQVSVDEADQVRRSGEKMQLIDVRRPAEFDGGHAAGAVNIPLDKLSAEIGRLDPSVPAYVICQSGYRSSLATSLLENAGFETIYNVTGGTKAWMDAGLEAEAASAAAG